MRTEVLTNAIAALQAERAEIDAALSHLQSLASDGAAPTLLITHNESFTGLGIAEAAARYLKHVGAPRTTREIMDALKAGGLTPKRYQTVYGLLHRRKQRLHDIHNSAGRWVALPQHDAHAT